MENFKEKMQKSGMDTCNRWGIYEVALDGPKEGNPFTACDGNISQHK